VKRLLSSKTTIDQQEYDVIIVGSGAVRRTLSVWFDENDVFHAQKGRESDGSADHQFPPSNAVRMPQGGPAARPVDIV